MPMPMPISTKIRPSILGSSLNFPFCNISTTIAEKNNWGRVGGGNQCTPLSKPVSIFQNTNTSVGNIIKTICFVTNTHPSHNDHTTPFHVISIPHVMVTRNSHYFNVALNTRSHCGPIFINSKRGI